jgi:UDP-2-acetamido-2-deoxy-ribo-hexuluronate aminotransferase
LDQYNAARRKAAEYYSQGFANTTRITVPYTAPNSSHVFHQYTILLNDENGAAGKRDGLNNWLAEKGIPSMIYYPVPCHRQKMFGALGGNDYQLKITDWLSERVISLPVHTELDQEQQDYIISNVLSYINSN